MSTKHCWSRVVVAWQGLGLRAVTRLLIRFLRTFQNCGGLSAQKCGGANPVSMRVAASYLAPTITLAVISSRDHSFKKARST